MEPSQRTILRVHFDTQDQYRALVNDPHAFRAHLLTTFDHHPELFPTAFSQGFHFHDLRVSTRVDLPIRRIRILASHKVLTVHPSFLMPYCTGLVQDFSRALILRRWAVPCWVLSWLFGRDPKVYERAWRRLADVNLVGATCRNAQIPEHLCADEKHTRLEGEKVFVATTAARGVVLGCELTNAAHADSLQEAYGVLFDQARALKPRWRPKSVCLDGWQAARAAWRRLSPRTVQVRCYLHEMLNLHKEAPKEKRRELLEQGWEVYHATSRGSFSQRLRRFEEKVRQTFGKGWWDRQVKARLARMRGRLQEYACAYSVAGAHRTSNQVDRQMQGQARQLAGQRGMRGSMETGKQTMRAMALVHNFHEYGPRTRRIPGNESRRSPFADLNGKVYADDWLENLLLASSCGGLRL